MIIILIHSLLYLSVVFVIRKGFDQCHFYYTVCPLVVLDDFAALGGISSFLCILCRMQMIIIVYAVNGIEMVRLSS